MPAEPVELIDRLLLEQLAEEKVKSSRVSKGSWVVLVSGCLLLLGKYLVLASELSSFSMVAL